MILLLLLTLAHAQWKEEMQTQTRNRRATELSEYRVYLFIYFGFVITLCVENVV